MPAVVAVMIGGAWQLPALAPGTRRFRLNWADRSHGNLNGPDTVVVHIRP